LDGEDESEETESLQRFAEGREQSKQMQMPPQVDILPAVRFRLFAPVCTLWTGYTHPMPGGGSDLPGVVKGRTGSSAIVRSPIRVFGIAALGAGSIPNDSFELSLVSRVLPASGVVALGGRSRRG
jgi:hypothetical protein